MHDKPGFKQFSLGSDPIEASQELHNITLDGWVVVSIQTLPSSVIVAWAKQGYSS